MTALNGPPGAALASDWPEVEPRGKLRVLAYAHEYRERFLDERLHQSTM